MQIQNNVSYCNYKSFGAKQIDTLNLLKKTENGYKPILATFSELEVNNKQDIDFIQKIKAGWENTTKYGKNICKNFLEKMENCRFFVTEVVDGNEKKVTNMMQIKVPTEKSNSYDIKFLQSAPDIANKFEISSPIKGSGETAIYEVAKLSKKDGSNGFSLMSTNDRFYYKIGLSDYGSVDNMEIFGLGSNKLQWFIDRVAKKYNLKNN